MFSHIMTRTTSVFSAFVSFYILFLFHTFRCINFGHKYGDRFQHTVADAAMKCDKSDTMLFQIKSVQCKGKMEYHVL